VRYIEIAQNPAIGQRQVMRRHLGGYTHAARFRSADKCDASGSADVADMQMRAGHFCQRNIARNHGFFGGIL
jgi:hypothetical protein